MKNAAAIFFLLLLVSIQTPVGQVFKLPLLIEHFGKHQKQDDVSLIDFLKDHYTEQHNDADWPEDEQLPFKNITFYSIGSAIVPATSRPHVTVPLTADKRILFPETYLLQQHLSSIFHPPRV